MIRIENQFILNGRRLLELWHENYEVKDYEFDNCNGKEFVKFVFSNWKKLFAKGTSAYIMQKFADDVATATYGKTEMFSLEEFDNIANAYKNAYKTLENHNVEAGLEFEYIRLLSSLCMIATVCTENYIGDDNNGN
nr:MAG TPA: hypothetical protein [Caudoviricetes sp.]